MAQTKADVVPYPQFTKEAVLYESSYKVSTTKDPGGGWAGEAVRAAVILERIADPEIQKLQEKVVKRREDYKKVAKKFKRAKKKGKKKPMEKAQKEVDKVKDSLLKATAALEEKTDGLTEAQVDAARELVEGKGNNWDDYLESAQKRHLEMLEERRAEVRRLRCMMQRFATTPWNFELPTEREAWLEEVLAWEEKERQDRYEREYWAKIGYYDEDGVWREHPKKKEKKSKKSKKKKKKKKKKKSKR